MIDTKRQLDGKRIKRVNIRNKRGHIIGYSHRIRNRSALREVPIGKEAQTGLYDILIGQDIEEIQQAVSTLKRIDTK